MKTIFPTLLAGLLLNFAAARPAGAAAALTAQEIHYTARLAEDAARFTVEIDAVATGAGESSLKLLEGDVAVLPGKLPEALKIVREKDRYWLVATRAGHFKFSLEIAAKIRRDEPWNQVTFTGPAAAIAAITAQANGTNTEIQLLNGTVLAAFPTNGVAAVTGFLGANQTVALRWQSNVAATVRQTLLTADAAFTALVTPAVIKYTSKFHYDVVQGGVAQIALALPTAQALTRLEGEQIRDWHTRADGSRQIVTIEFIKPLDDACDFTVYSEQATDGAAKNSPVNPPQPLDVERESGSLTIFAEDTLVEVASLAGLRQVNAPERAVSAYRFHARPFALALRLKRIEPVIGVADRVQARLEETRLVATHRLALNVERAGIYALTLTLPPDGAVADVRGEGIEDWKVDDGKLSVDFSARLLGQRPLEVQLERAVKTFAEPIRLAPLRVGGAAQETAEIGVAAAPGLRVKTGSLAGLREIPASELPDHADEILAYAANQPDWQLSLAGEKLAARVVADVFNLVTIGDGLVGGSATIRYGLVNQGVQEFKVRVPARFKNVEFTGPNIRRKEQAGDVWTIGLQDKVWGGYTLVVTYDEAFAATGATLPLGGVHAVDVERETGSIAVATAASLQLAPRTVSDTLRRVDEADLPDADRSLATRPVVFAWQYTGDQYMLAVDAKRFAEEPVLAAVADRTQITSVLTAAGEMLTQASFMVKNNEKQFQRFQLPRDATLWGCYVNGRSAKPERDGDWVLVALPRDASRDQAFAVDITYAQTNGALAAPFGKKLELAAPRTDVPDTYAEWRIFVPPALRLSDFGGSMSVTQGTTYGLFDAWEKFLAFYAQVLCAARGSVFVLGLLAVLVIALVVAAARRGWNGVITLLAVCVLLAVLGAMLLPALARAKKKAQAISSVNNLKQIGLAARIFSGDNADRLPVSFDEMKNELGSDKVTYDPATGQRYTYLGGGRSLNDLKPDSVLAYSAPDPQGRSEVLFADGSVQTVSAGKFDELSQRGLVQLAAPDELAGKQREALSRRPLAKSALAAPAAIVNDGFAGFSGRAKNDEPAAALPAAPPVAAGLHSLHIELPQTGQPFLFTKVLNLRGEPLSIRARVMPLQTFQIFQMLWQAAAFLLGLVVWWTQWRRANRHSLVLALALALILGSVASLLIQWRALHGALILGFSLLAIAGLAALLWKYWPRRAKMESTDNAAEPPAPASGLPPVVAAVMLLLAFSSLRAMAANVQSGDGQPDNITASIRFADYSGTVNGHVAQLAATLQFSGVKAGEILPLFGADAAVRQFSVRTGRATLVRAGDRLAARFERGGDAVVQIKMLVNVASDGLKRRLALAIPPALSSRISLALDEAEADVEFPGAVSFQRRSEQNQTRVEAVMGSAERMELAWSPRGPRADAAAATVFCRATALATFGGGVMNLRATLAYQITQGELRQARVRLPADQKLLRVAGRGIRTWAIQETNGAPVLVVDLVKGVTADWPLTLEMEKPLAPLPADVAVALPRALDVQRENGLVALRGAEELALSVAATAGLERVEAEEFQRATAATNGAPASVFRFAAPEFSLRIHADAVQPQIEAVARNDFRVSPNQISLAAAIHYQIKRAGVFALRVALPDGYRVECVSGKGVLQSAERAETGAARRVLEVTLGERTSGACAVNLELTRQFQALPPSLVLAGALPLDAVKLTGLVSVAAAPGVAVKTEALDGLAEIPAALLADDSSAARAENVLAYKFIAPAPKVLPAWKLTVATETVAAWVRAEIVNTFTLAETLVSGRAVARYEIASAPVKELRVAVPADYQNVEINGANIRSREIVGTNAAAPAAGQIVWRVELQSPVRGLYPLTVTWDAPRPAQTNALELAGIAAVNVERETGYFAVTAQPPLQVSEISAAELQRVDALDLPDWAAVTGDVPALAYRYPRPGAKLVLAARRFADAAVLAALVDRAQFTSVVAEDGQMLTEMTLSVRNHGRQFLAVELPPAAQAWSAFVAGQPVRPSRRDGKLLLPIPPSGADDGALTVQLTYAGTNAFPRTRGDAGFASPKFDVPVKNARWEIYLPPDYRYLAQAKGTMTRETADTAPPTADFSLLDYSRMEQANRAAAQKEVERDVHTAWRLLSSGNVREATANFNRARRQLDAAKDADVKKLGDELQTAQASNLIHAQNDFFRRNAGLMDTPAAADFGVADDRAAAGEQWAKLQQTQEIATAKVQPLRVNLPLRGQRFAFTQALQTESGQPMTFWLYATNTRTIHWPARLAAGLAAFLALWAAVAVFSCRTRQTT